jgi:hypothetical protein
MDVKGKHEFRHNRELGAYRGKLSSQGADVSVNNEGESFCYQLHGRERLITAQLVKKSLPSPDL